MSESGNCVDDVDYSIGAAGLVDDSSEGEGAQSAHAGGFDDESVASGKGRGDFVGGEVERPVVRNDGENGADWDACGGYFEVLGTGISGSVDFAGVVLEGQFGGEFESQGESGYFGFGLGDWLTDFASHEFGQFVMAFGDKFGDAVEEVGSGLGGGESPSLEGGVGGIDCGRYLAPPGFGGGADELSVVRGRMLSFANALVARTADENAIDQEFLMHGFMMARGFV